MKNKRNINLDLIRCIAVISVISVHFFLNNGFYNEPINNSKMIIMLYLRTFFMICVPIFIILTGYLMSKKEISKKYYLKIEKTIFTYIIASILCILYKIIFLNKEYTIFNIIGLITSFKGSRYAWYVNMYLGLYLLIPFLNLIYNNLKNKKEKHLLLITLILLTIFPSFINIKYKILPSWWTNIYPITYYFVGAYLREYKINIKPFKNLILIILSVIIFGTISLYFSYNRTFISNSITSGWNTPQSFIITTLVFIFLININLNNLPNKLKNIIYKISNRSFGIYLVSYIFDDFFYSYLNKYIKNTPDKLYYFILIIIIVLIYSYILSTLIDHFKNLLIKLKLLIIKIIKNKQKKEDEL